MPDRQEPRPRTAEEIKALTDRLRAIHDAAENQFALSGRVDPNTNPQELDGGTITVEFDQFVERRAKEIFEEADRDLADPDMAEFIARVAEQAVRMALIVAVGRGSRTISRADLDWAYPIARQSAFNVKEGAEDYMAESLHEADLQRIVRVVKARKKWVPYRDIEPPPLKWSILRYGSEEPDEEDQDAEEEAQG